jgi:hypothetical protein
MNPDLSVTQGNTCRLPVFSFIFLKWGFFALFLLHINFSNLTDPLKWGFFFGSDVPINSWLVHGKPTSIPSLIWFHS